MVAGQKTGTQTNVSAGAAVMTSKVTANNPFAHAGAALGASSMQGPQPPGHQQLQS